MEPEIEVLPETTQRPKVLAKTGAETTAAWLGLLFLSLGLVMRSVRFSSPATVFAGQSSVAFSVALAAFDRVSTGARSFRKWIRPTGPPR